MHKISIAAIITFVALFCLYGILSEYRHRQWLEKHEQQVKALYSMSVNINGLKHHQYYVTGEQLCNPDKEDRKACIRCCESEYWELGKTPEGRLTTKPLLCVEYCLRVAEAFCWNSFQIDSKCTVVADKY